MCGIAGIVDFDRVPLVEDAASMASLLAHRGPDDAGTFGDSCAALAHRRLSIIDLSSLGRQPMTDAVGGLQLVFNGEIYNHPELRADLERRGHRFRTRTDTEVVVAAYREWGDRCVERFNGMWAFAIWDAAARTLFCSRDRFGEKPFYYRIEGRRLVFASELKAFRASSRRLEPNPGVVHDFLAQAYLDHTDETFFAGIRQLPAAHSLTFTPTGSTIRRYWRLEPRTPPAQAAEAVRELFLDAVRIRLRSDVAIGTCLSGGIDSSAIACGVDHLLREEPAAAAPVGARQRTFTSYFTDEGLDERPYARAVIDRIGAEAHWISVGDDDLEASLPSIVDAQDEPFRSTSIVAQWHVMQEARRAGVKVMLDGQGADELLAGYDGYFGYLFASLLRERRLRDFAAEVRAHRRVRGASPAETAAALVRPYLSAAASRRARGLVGGGARLCHPDLRAAHRAEGADVAGFEDPLRRQLLAVLTHRLPELLHYEDRNSMAHSLEARVPFLDHRLAELLLSLDLGELIERGRTKAVLRRALGDLLPAIVRERTDKIGFETPEARWFRGRLGRFADEVFHSREFAQRGFVDATAARRRLERHRRDGSGGSELWRALSVELWARAYLDGQEPARRFRSAA